MRIEKCYCDVCGQEVKTIGKLGQISCGEYKYVEVCESCQNFILDAIEKLKINGGKGVCQK